MFLLLIIRRPPRSTRTDTLLPYTTLFRSSEAFDVGAQGGWVAREQRKTMLTNAGLLPSQTARLRSPVGLIGHARDPAVLALSILAEIVRVYEALVDRDSDE